jgi:hypothetical protein
MIKKGQIIMHYCIVACLLLAPAVAFSGCKKQALNKQNKILMEVKKDLSKSMVTFASDYAFDAYTGNLAKKSDEYYKAQYSQSYSYGMGGMEEEAMPSSPAPASADSSMAKSEAAAPEGGDSESITNVQEQGVDEGDIVKVFKDYLVVLRRGRIFTVDLKDKDEPVLKPISKIDAYPPGFTMGTWYDEMLIYKNTIIVVGYSYGVSATEVGKFSIDEDGKLKHLSSHYIDSNDYYSSRNYASRLVDNHLIFYMPYYLWGYYGYGYGGGERKSQLPKIKRWVKDNELTEGKEILSKTDIYMPVQETLNPTLHMVASCDLDKADMTCTGKAVLGPYSRTFYVSPNAIYIWVSGEYEAYYFQPQPAATTEGETPKKEPRSYVYMIMIDDGSARALRAGGAPVDQFSFKEDSDGHLNVLLRDSGFGDAMWEPEVTTGSVALLRTSLKNFSDNPQPAPEADYMKLPQPTGYDFQNRFVGDYLLYGTGGGWYYDPNSENNLYLKNYKKAEEAVQKIPLNHSVDRIEVMGSGAVVIGTDNTNLKFSSFDLGPRAELKNTFSLENAMQGELRSHGFFFKPAEDGGGILGLPVRRQGYSYQNLWYESAEIVYLKVTPEKEFVSIGSLLSKEPSGINDACMASCTDWYGNSRPIFYKGRIFALLGYELVEGYLEGSELKEQGRINIFGSLPSDGTMPYPPPPPLY